MSGTAGAALTRHALRVVLLASACAGLPAFGQAIDPTAADASAQAHEITDTRRVTGARVEPRSAIGVERNGAEVSQSGSRYHPGARFRF